MRYLFDIPSDDIEDGPSRRRFAHLLRQMLGGKLTQENLPPLDDLHGYGDCANACLTYYFQDQIAKFAELAATLLRADPALSDAVFSATPDTALPPSLRVLRPSELANLPPVSFLDADKLIQDMGISMVYGKPGVGKSLWALAKAHEIARRQPVIYVAAEAQSSLTDRVAALGIALREPMPEQVHLVMQPVNLRQPEQVQALTDYAIDAGAGLVVFDTWAGCTAGADENSVRDVQPIFNTLEQFKTDVGCGILLIHHTRKDSAVYRGSSAIQGALDNMYLLTDEDGRLRLKADKTRDSQKPDAKHYRLVQFETRTHPDTGEPVHAPALLPASKVVDEPDATPERVDGNQRIVLEALDAFEDGLTTNNLINATGLEENAFYRTLPQLLKAGYITKVKEGRNRRYTISSAGLEAMR